MREAERGPGVWPDAVHEKGASGSDMERSWFMRVVVLGSWAVVSRFLGLFRDLAIAWLVGSSLAADALVAALVLPHAVRKLLADGVLSLPVTAAASAGCEELEGRRLLNGRTILPALRLLVAGACVLLALFLLGAGPAMWLAGPGHASDAAWMQEASTLFRLASPYVPFACVGALAMGLLHARGRFSEASQAPICFNCTILLFLALAGLGLDTAAHCAALGFAVAGLVQLTWLFRALRRSEPGDGELPCDVRASSLTGEGMVSSEVLDSDRSLSSRLRRGVLAMPGIALAASSLPLALCAAMVATSLAGEGAMTALYFADRLLEMPAGIIGACMGMAVLPELASDASSGNAASFMQRLRMTLHVGLLFALPATAGLAAIAGDLVPLLLGHGNFTAEGVLRSTVALVALVPALPACVLLRTLIAACHAQGEDRRTICSTIAMAIAVAFLGLFLLLLLPRPLATAAGPLAACLGLWGQVFYLFRKVIGNGARPLFGYERFLTPGSLLRQLVCAAVCGAVAFWVASSIESAALSVLAACLAGGILWTVAVRLLAAEDFHLVFSSLRRARR